jgi:sigma-E factor negative regulatory protein RseC
MIEENAIVIGLERDMAVLEVIRSKPCGLCGQTRGCGISLWGRLLGHRKNLFKAINQIKAKPGDNVVVGVEEQALLISSLTIYGIPLAAMLAGALLGGVFAGDAGNADAYAVMGAISGLMAGLLWLKGHNTGRSMHARYQPVILRLDNGSGINLKRDEVTE